MFNKTSVGEKVAATLTNIRTDCANGARLAVGLDRLSDLSSYGERIAYLALAATAYEEMEFASDADDISGLGLGDIKRAVREWARELDEGLDPLDGVIWLHDAAVLVREDLNAEAARSKGFTLKERLAWARGVALAAMARSGKLSDALSGAA